MNTTTHTADPNDLWDDDYPEFRLIEYLVYSKSPMRDPFQLSRTTVIAPSMEEALTYLIQAGRWDTVPELCREMRSTYDCVPQKLSTQGKGMTKGEWINAVLLGYLPNPVRLVEGAIVAQPKPQPLSEPKAKKSRTPRPRRFMAGIERFFDRQSRYPRTWKAIGTVVAIVAALGVLWMLWNLVVSLISLYLIARGIGAYLGGRW